MNAPTPDFTVVGAGVVGASCALYLQREGFSVALVEKGAPGEGASSGNAGSLGIASIVPTGVPGLVQRVPRMLLDPTAPLIVRWRHLAALAPWLARLVLNSHGDRFDAIVNARAALLSRALDAYGPLLTASRLQDVMVQKGRLFVYGSDAAFSDDSLASRIRRQHGIRMQPLTPDQAREIEPTLGSYVRSAAYFPDVHQIANPLRLVRGLVQHFTEQGGKVIDDEVKDFRMADASVTAIVGARHTYSVKNVVLAAGAWSRTLAAKLGVTLPIEAERGYNVSISNPSIRLNLPVTIADKYLGVSPMEDGLRICGMAEFAGLEAPPDYRRADVLLTIARQVFPALASDEPSSRWMGPRPSLPDSLPAIGRSKNVQNVLFACGHDHLGLTMGPITGRLIASLAAGSPPELDLAPYAPDRFGFKT